MKTLTSNRDLYDYLHALHSTLNERGAVDLSDIVRRAMGQAAAMSTEFLGESRIALRRLLREGCAVLTAEEQDDVSQVLGQLDNALDRRARR